MTLLEKTDDHVINVLFLCPGNDGPSLIAESLLHCAGGGRYWAYSAGSCPADEADPLALETLRDAGLPTGDLRPKDWTLFTRSGAPKMDLIVSLTPFIPYGILPAFPGQPFIASWSVDDLTRPRNSTEDRKAAFKDMLREIEARVIRLDKDGEAGLPQPVAGARFGDLGCPNLEQGGLGVNPGVAEADDLVGTPGDHPDVHRPAAVGRVDGVHAELGEHRVDGGGEKAQQLTAVGVGHILAA